MYPADALTIIFKSLSDHFGIVSFVSWVHIALF